MIRRLLIAMLCALCLPTTAPQAAHPLSEVAEIDDGLMAIAIADEMRRRCDGVQPRYWRAFQTLRQLEARARDLGFSDAQIEAYVTSDAEKARMREKATAWLAERSVDVADTDAFCGYARRAIDAENAIGRLLR